MSQKKMGNKIKLLFFPNALGGGFGHIGRCLALADTFHQKGHEVMLALNGPHVKTVMKTGYKTFNINYPPFSANSRKKEPAYLYVPGMAYQIVRDGFDNPRAVKRGLAETYKIIESTKPDLLIGDGYPLTWLLGHRAGIPVVQLVKSIAHPSPEQMIWWEDEPENLISPDPRPVFNPVLSKSGLPEITKAEQLLSGDLLLLPSIYQLDPMEPLPDKTHYVGSVTREPNSKTIVPDWFSDLDGSTPVIYVTVGGAAGQVGGTNFFNIVSDAFGSKDWQVVVSTGQKIDPRSVGLLPSNIRLVQWVPGAEMIARSDLVVFHGGYTRLEILKAGLPSIVIPFHSEQEYYGRLLEKAGVTKVVHYSDEPYKCIINHWKGGNRWRKSKPFSVHIKPNITLQPNTLKKAVQFSLFDQKMRLNAQAIQAELKNYGGSEKTIDLIESKLL
jgi:UDP:flavonoid glycosyltransferase YjiC (YdhE family)